MSKPRLPNIGEHVRSVGTLVSIEDVTPVPVKTLDYIFQLVTARVESRLNGQVISPHVTFNEFYGEGTAVKAAIGEAKKLAESYGPSNVQFVVVKITEHIRKRPSWNQDENFYDD